MWLDVSPRLQDRKESHFRVSVHLTKNVQDCRTSYANEHSISAHTCREEQQQGYLVWGNELELQGGSQNIEVYFIKMSSKTEWKMF